ncbi:F420-0--gamma-glutamyl ligase,putative folate metabolism gamma-glutamate ligase,F420-0:Gamma-glutamyl ligase [Chlamydia poikilotherma]|uniref:F420-0--gamma-glutamyl ligase,putative folate metabolism gamma-glutamate ligase,F420-0:Gamma-glutamyl ligase n=1 Tax=Chlamydia poikilotherma TaxID=1967783 RepID=A0A3B0Q991_9CHLA|nr:putative folate metabolism gamma-glutamate ligase [Chlamydia poikilotherma]SYX09457.1 F420-0--gamma-glutamyl ligase,putative folate metabolism gamma-glutamate ligase,F420-0:Gamma-glutamyl ligase [Chlamydia poikilotherma]
MKVTPIVTRKVHVYDDLYELLEESLPSLSENSVIALSSKVLSLCEGAVVDTKTTTKEALIKQESDAYVYSAFHDLYLTKKHGILIPSAGIDESNAQDYYVLYPRDLLASTNALGVWLKNFYHLENLGVIIVDSHTTPMRRGVLGLGLCWYGFSPLYSYVGKPDCFGRPLRMTQINLLDALAVSAVLCMGEGDEHTPLALIEDAPKISFHSSPTLHSDLSLLGIDETEDLYGPILRSVVWESTHF